MLAGTVAIQLIFAVSHTPDPHVCLANGIIPYQPAIEGVSPASGVQGWEGVCNIVLGLTSTAEQVVLILGIALGAVTGVIGLRTYRRVDTRRKRDHLITGAVFGGQAVNFGVLLLIFVQSPQKFALQFMNFYQLRGHDGWALVNGIKFTLLLAFGGDRDACMQRSNGERHAETQQSKDAGRAHAEGWTSGVRGHPSASAGHH